MYALERNSWKTKNRDKRKIKIQRVEIDYLAPDTAEEIITALSMLDTWLRESGIIPDDIAGTNTGIKKLACQNFENSRRNQVIIKPLEAIIAYRQMLHYYAVKKIAAFFDQHPEMDFNGLNQCLNPSGTAERIKDWVNAGGQIVPAFRMDELRREIGEGKYKSWDEIHRVYEIWEEGYALDKCRHAWFVLVFLQETDRAISADVLKKEFAAVVEIRNLIDKQIYASREKDYRNPFKKSTFRNMDEMEQVLGKHDDNPFIRLIHKESADFKEMIERVSARLTK
jgi:hypothetical protein